jgi:hypothetical protein
MIYDAMIHQQLVYLQHGPLSKLTRTKLIVIILSMPFRKVLSVQHPLQIESHPPELVKVYYAQVNGIVHIINLQLVRDRNLLALGSHTSVSLSSFLSSSSTLCSVCLVCLPGLSVYLVFSMSVCLSNPLSLP